MRYEIMNLELQQDGIDGLLIRWLRVSEKDCDANAIRQVPTTY